MTAPRTSLRDLRRLGLIVLGYMVCFVPIAPVFILPLYAAYLLVLRYCIKRNWTGIRRIEFRALLPLIVFWPVSQQYLVESRSDLLTGMVWAFAIFLSFAIRLFELQRQARRHRHHNAFMILVVIFGLLSVELMLREHPVGLRFQTQNVGINFVLDRTLLWAPRNMRINWSADRAGFAKNDLKSGQGPYEVAFFGGSATAGKKLEKRTKAFPYLIANKLTQEMGPEKLHVVNAGVDSYTTFQIRRLIEMTKEAADVDLMVLYVGFNDAMEVPGPYTQKEAWEILYGKPGSFTKQGIGLVQNTIGRLRTYQLLARGIVPFKEILCSLGGREAIHAVSHKEILENLEAVHSFCNRNRIQMVICSEAHLNYLPLPSMSALKEFAELHPDVTFLDLNSSLRQREDYASLFFPGDNVHLSEKGHVVVADRILDGLHNYHLLPTGK